MLSFLMLHLGEETGCAISPEVVMGIERAQSLMGNDLVGIWKVRALVVFIIKRRDRALRLGL